jgi:hypothetical protein
MSEIKDTANAYILLADDHPKYLERVKQWMGRYGYTQVD